MNISSATGYSKKPGGFLCANSLLLCEFQKQSYHLDLFENYYNVIIETNWINHHTSVSIHVGGGGGGKIAGGGK